MIGGALPVIAVGRSEGEKGSELYRQLQFQAVCPDAESVQVVTVVQAGGQASAGKIVQAQAQRPLPAPCRQPLDAGQLLIRKIDAVKRRGQQAVLVGKPGAQG